MYPKMASIKTSARPAKNKATNTPVDSIKKKYDNKKLWLSDCGDNKPTLPK